MRIAWLQDLNPFAHGGGAQATDKTHIIEGIHRGHDIEVITPGAPVALGAPMIVSNAHSFSLDLFQQMQRQEVPYVWFSHDYTPICLMPGSEIMTDDGLKPIEQIATGDRVLSSQDMSLVLQRMSRAYDGPIIEVAATGCLPVSMTPEHEVLTCSREAVRQQHRQNNWRKYNREHGIATVQSETVISQRTWKPAKALTLDDYVAIPRLKTSQSHVIHLNEYLATYAKARGHTRPDVLVTAELAWALGRWLADGSASGGTASVCYGEHEHEAAKRWCEIIESTVGAKCRIRAASEMKMNGRALYSFAHSKPFMRFLASEFGHSACAKRIPAWVIHLPENLLLSFLRGYISGDGCILPKKNNTVCLSTCSPQIVQGLSVALAKVGMVANISKIASLTFTIRGHTYRSRGGFQLQIPGPQVEQLEFSYTGSASKPRHFVENDLVWTPITKLTERYYNGPVYNLETMSSDYSTAFLVHNCKQRLFYPLAEPCFTCYLKPRWLPVIQAARLIIWLSPLHREAWLQLSPELESHPYHLAPSPVDSRVFYGLGQPRSGAIAVNSLYDFKGRRNVLRWAEEHQDMALTVVGDNPRPADGLPPNCRVIGEVPYGQLNELYNQHEAFLHLPDSPQPFDRTCAEAYLAGCRIIANELVGALSWPFFREGREAVAAALRESPRQFWEAVEGVLR